MVQKAPTGAPGKQQRAASDSPSEVPAPIDPVLHPFLDAAGDLDAERELNTLVERHVLPLARAIAGHNLRPYSSHKRSEIDGRDDVVSEALLALVERLRLARNDPQRAAIGNLHGYVAAVVHSRCAHFIRSRHPERARFKNRLRYVFSTDPHLALWQTDNNQFVCGLTEWHGRQPDAAAARALGAILERRGAGWTDATKRRFAAAVVALVGAAGGPLQFDEFVTAAATAGGIVEPNESTVVDTLPSNGPAADIMVDQQRFLRRVWTEVSSLPVRQRTALLLNLRDAFGAGLLWLFPICGIATISDIASMLDIAMEEFAKLWREIPLDDAAIARRLGCERQHVINLRMAARKRLWNRTRANLPADFDSVRSRV